MSKPMNRTSELTDVIHRIIRHRPRLRAIVPQDLAQLKAKLAAMHLDGHASGVDDFDVMLKIGVILAHQPEGVTMGEVSKAMDVPLSTATRIVDWLVNSGYAARLADKDDRRVVRVAFTSTGESLFGTLNDFIRKRADWLLRHFTPEEQTQFLKLISKLADALEEEAVLDA